MAKKPEDDVNSEGWKKRLADIQANALKQRANPPTPIPDSPRDSMDSISPQEEYQKLVDRACKIVDSAKTLRKEVKKAHIWVAKLESLQHELEYSKQELKTSQPNNPKKAQNIQQKISQIETDIEKLEGIKLQHEQTWVACEKLMRAIELLEQQVTKDTNRFIQNFRSTNDPMLLIQEFKVKLEGHGANKSKQKKAAIGYESMIKRFDAHLEFLESNDKLISGTNTTLRQLTKELIELEAKRRRDAPRTIWRDEEAGKDVVLEKRMQKMGKYIPSIVYYTPQEGDRRVIDPIEVSLARTDKFYKRLFRLYGKIPSIPDFAITSKNMPIPSKAEDLPSDVKASIDPKLLPQGTSLKPRRPI